MDCPFCKSTNVDVPMVDIGVGEQQCGPASCLDCGAAQDYDGRWQPADYWETPKNPQAPKPESD